MTQQDDRGVQGGSLSRRTLVAAIAAGATVAGSRRVLGDAEKGTPPSVVTSPPRQFGSNAPPNVYGFDPDIVIVDPLFTQYVQGNTPIQRLWTGALWNAPQTPFNSAEGTLHEIDSDPSCFGPCVSCLPGIERSTST
jgi:gluconolactonase